MPSRRTGKEGTAPVCLGTGLIALDVVTNGDGMQAPRLWAGGSCGNVMTVLAYLGWQALPVGRLGKDGAAKLVADDMRQHEVDLKYVTYDERVDTPIILEKIFTSAHGMPSHRFHWVCPQCGNWLPRYRPIRLRDISEASIELREESVDCFYFDRVSPAALRMAREAKARGVLVVFEPPSVKGDDQFKKAVGLCDVLKYAGGGRACSSGRAHNSSAPIVVETLGAEGLRYRIRRGARRTEWKVLEAFHVSSFRDAAGAGDWCSAGMIDVLVGSEIAARPNVKEEGLVKALRYGQALSALNCAFDGARGAMYGLDKASFGRHMEAILDRKEAVSAHCDGVSAEAKQAVRCICPRCKEHARSPSAKKGRM